jgi:RNase P subunit RPR2
MRASLNETNSSRPKAPVKTKTGTLIRLPIKKIYCTKCQQLVKGQTQNSGNTTQIICPRCSQTLWFWKSISWRRTGNGADISP